MKKWIALLLIIVFVASSPAAYAAAMLSDTGDDSETTSAASTIDADKAQSYAEAERLLASGDTARAAMAFGRAIGYKDAKERSFALWDGIAQRDTIAAGEYYFTVGLRSDGTVVATEPTGYPYNHGQCEVSDWTDIMAVSAGAAHTVGLRTNGTVATVGAKWAIECNVSNWKDIVAIDAGRWHTVGLRADGTVVAAGNNEYGQCNVSDWSDIVAIVAGSYHTVGLRADGTVVATKYTGIENDYNYGQCDVNGWTNIVAISAGDYHTVGLRADGSVVATKHAEGNYGGQCEVDDWTNIVAISAGCYQTVGLRADGTVVATEYDAKGTKYQAEYYGQCNVSDWRNIAAVSTSTYHTVGIRVDGTVVAVGFNYGHQCDVSEWSNIKLPITRTWMPSPEPASTPISQLSTPAPDGSFNYTILQNEPGYLYDKFDDYWTWYAAYDEPYLDADLIIGIQLEGEMGGTDLAGVTLYTKIMDKNGRSIDGVSSMVFLIDGVKYSYNEMAEEDGAMAGAVVLYDSGYELIKAFASANEVSVKLNLFSGNTVRLDLNETEFNNTLKYISRKIIDYRLWDYYIENPALGIIELMFPLEITKK